MESARNSTFRNPFTTPVHCQSAADFESQPQNLVAGRTIAAASVAEGGETHKKNTFLFPPTNQFAIIHHFRFMRIWFSKIFCTLRFGRHHQLWYNTHNGRSTRFGEMSLASRRCQI